MEPDLAGNEVRSDQSLLWTERQDGTADVAALYPAELIRILRVVGEVTGAHEGFHAREQRATKRGGGKANLSFDESIGLAAKPEVDLVVLDEVLKKLETIDPRQSRIVELKYDVPTAGMLSVKTTVSWQHVGQPERSHVIVAFLHPGLE